MPSPSIQDRDGKLSEQIHNPFQHEPDFPVASITYSRAELLSKAIVATGIGLHA